MGEPRAITFKEVEKASMDEYTARETWRKIGDITGAGHVPPGDYASIDLTDVSDSKRERIDKLLMTTTEDTAHAEAVASETKKKRGNQ
jgi:hypothetical protein